MFTYLLQQNIRSTHFIIVSLLIYYIDTSYCEVEQGKTKTSDDVSFTSTQQQLTLPNLNDCKNRIQHIKFGGHGYFFSWQHEKTKNLTVNWLTGRNICRRHCMDLISLETPEEITFLQHKLITGKQRFTWTSGRKCNFDGCDRTDLKPAIIRGWFWSATGVNIPANSDGTKPEGPWSKTGGDGTPQPDNREFRLTGRNDEACLAVLNNFYADGIAWHDIACYHKKPFICEDNQNLLNFIQQSNPGVTL